MIAYTLYMVFVQKRLSMSKRIGILGLTTFLCVIALYLVFTLGVGGRLLEMGLFDDKSAQARVDVWDMFDYVSLRDLLWGNTMSMRRLIMYKAGLNHLENFWIEQIFAWGIVFMVIYVSMWVAVIRKMYRKYTWFSAAFSAGAFVLLASINNSLSVDFTPLFIFLLCIIIFDKETIKKTIPVKYIDFKA